MLDSAAESAGPAGEAAPVPSAEEYQALLEEKAGVYDQLIRLKAEFENYRKRVDREKPGCIAHGKEEALAKLLPLYDVLLTAHDSIERHGQGSSTGELKRGLEMIFQEFTKLFKAEGVETIPAVGQRYDFNLHEALGQVAGSEHEEGVVVEELQRGYTLGGKVLRAAKVRVAGPK